MIYLGVIMDISMVITLVEVVLLVVSFGYLIFLYVKPYKPETDKPEEIIRDEAGNIISIDGIPFDEYMERL